MSRRALAAATLAAAVACGAAADGPPAIDVDRTACTHCGMFISEAAYAAAYREPGAEAKVFDDIGCLLQAARAEPRRDSLRYWFQDAAGSGWIAGTDAAFVSSPSLRTPMGGGLIAYRNHAAAADGAARHKGRVVPTLDELLRSTNNTGRDRAPDQPH